MTDPGQPGQPYHNFGSHNEQNDAPGGYPQQPGEGEARQPYGAAQQPYGAAQPPYGAQPPYEAPPQQKKGGAGKVVGIIAGVLVALLVICGVLVLVVRNVNKTSTLNAKVSDCIHTDGDLDSATAQQVKNAKIVKCDSADAKYKVVGLVDNKTENDFNTDAKICDAYPTAKSAMWQATDGKTVGKVLCLAPAK